MLQKIQRISIPEGGRGRGFTTGKLETALQGGGNCFWVPLSAVRLGRLSAHKNGTYKAEEAGVYGYSEAVINVNSYVTNGNRIIYPDSLEEAELPCALEIVYLPTRVQEGLPFKSGERIDTSGLLVRALMEDGSVWPDSPMRNGFVPYRELIIEPERADMDEAMQLYATEDGVQAIKLYTKATERPNFCVGPIIGYTDEDDHLGRFNPTTIRTLTPSTVFLTVGPDGRTYGAYISGDNGSGVATDFPDKQNAYSHKGWVENHSGGFRTGFEAFAYLGDYTKYWQDVPISSVNPRGVRTDALTFAGAKQTVTVSWTRPGDGMLLSTEFEIDVVEGGPSAHSGSSHSSQPIGG